MRKIIRRWFWAWDFDKEEQWLNEMAAKGLALVAVGFCKYTFEECTPGTYNIRLELLQNPPGHAESQQYIGFIEESGAEYLGSLLRWVYFRRKTDTGEFNLYSDNASRIKHLNRLLELIGVICVLNAFFGFLNLSSYFGTGTTANLFFAVLNLTLALLIAYGCLRVFRKKRVLKKQQTLFE